jgi:hypothetical protein
MIINRHANFGSPRNPRTHGLVKIQGFETNSRPQTSPCDPHMTSGNFLRSSEYKATRSDPRHAMRPTPQSTHERYQASRRSPALSSKSWRTKECSDGDFCLDATPPRAHGVVVSHLLRMRKAVGSIHAMGYCFHDSNPASQIIETLQLSAVPINPE